MKKSFRLLTAAALLGLAAGSANASNINVGGVVWDPDSAASPLPLEQDFTSHGGLIESSVDLARGITHVTGRGIINQVNSTTPNSTSFCPTCELTYTFSMDLLSINPIAFNFSTFSFGNLAVNVYVDTAKNYTGSLASAADGVLWLSLVGNGNLLGTGTDIGTGSDRGSGDALLDVIGGIAKGNFDTNTKLNGADMALTSSFQPSGLIEGGVKMLTGTLDLTGNSIPEPGSLALLGLGLVGLAGLRKRKTK